jgi:predicted dehydrogenase
VVEDLVIATLYFSSYELEWQYFLNTVRGVVPPVSTAEEAVHRMRIVEALYRSAQERQEVVLEASG